MRCHVEGHILSAGYGHIRCIYLAPTKNYISGRWRDSQILAFESGGDNISPPEETEGVRGHIREYRPADILREAVILKKHGSIGVAFLGKEPLLNWEFIRETAERIHDSGLKNVLVSSGTADPSLLGRLGKRLDAVAVNIPELDPLPPGIRRRFEDRIFEFIRQAAGITYTEIITDGADPENAEKWAKRISEIKRGIPLRLNTDKDVPEEIIGLSRQQALKYLYDVRLG